jgi:hypothetical protein
MELRVELNKNQQTASVVFAGRDDFAFVTEWRKTLNDDQNPIRVDAVDFAQLAVSRFEAHSAIQPYAKSIDDIGDHIGHNPKCEVANFVLLTCDWFPASRVIGMCHFRRTWSNGIVLDYLAAHPFIAKPPTAYTYQVRGVGTALLYFLSLVAKRYVCKAIWGEATQGSCRFYQNALKLDPVEDLIYAPQEKFIDFIARLNMCRAEARSAVSPKDMALTEVYDIEMKNPPFVGSKTAVFNPARRLAYRFLDLPHHEQRAIAEELKLIHDEDKNQSADEQFRRFFRRATETEKLPDLWRAVEEKYPDGEADKNPFSKAVKKEGRNHA